MEGELPVQTPVEQVESRRSVLPVIVLLTVALVGAIGVGVWMRNNPRTSKQTQSGSLISNTPTPRIPMPVFIEKVDSQTLTSLNQLPHTYPVRKQQVYKDWVFSASNDQFFQFDALTKKIIRFTDSTNLRCGFDFTIHRDYLFLVCNKPDYTDQRIYEIDLATFRVKRTFGRENGILSERNYELLGDADTLWVATFNGIGQIDLPSGKVRFYKDVELGLEGESNAILWLKQDERAVWFYVSANVKTNGGFVMWDKQTKRLVGFGPSQLLVSGRVDLAQSGSGYGFRFVKDGVEVAISGPGLGYTQVAYSYVTDEWRMVGMVKDVYANKEFEKIFPPYRPTYSFKPEWDMYPVAMAPVSPEKVYMLDNTGIGVLEQGQLWPSLFLPIKKDLRLYNPDLDSETSVFYVRPADERGFAFLSLFCAMGDCANPEIVFFDLKKPELLSRTIIDSSKHPIEYQKLTVQTGASGLVELLTADKKVYATVDLDKQKFTFAD